MSAGLPQAKELRKRGSLSSTASSARSVNSHALSPEPDRPLETGVVHRDELEEVGHTIIACEERPATAPRKRPARPPSRPG